MNTLQPTIHVMCCNPACPNVDNMVNRIIGDLEDLQAMVDQWSDVVEDQDRCPVCREYGDPKVINVAPATSKVRVAPTPEVSQGNPHERTLNTPTQKETP